jgi:hypothetical protein
MSFVPENPLEEALLRAGKNAMTRREFKRLLLDSDLVVVGRVEGREFSQEGGALRPGEKLKLGLVERGGQRCIPCFTSNARLKAGIEQHTAYVTLKGRALFEMTRGVTVILNMGSELGWEFTPDAIDDLLDRKTIAPRRIVIDKPTEALVGQPAVYPQALVDALKRAFEAKPDVLAAYLVQIAFAGTPPHPLIGVETIGDWNAVSAEIARVAAEVAPGAMIDAMQVDHNKSDGVMHSLLQTEPFFFRRTATT